MALTIAEVAGVINVGVVLFQFTFPMILMLVLVGIAARANNAATWSVTGRLLNGTWWPSVLRTDAAATSRVSKRVLFISYFSTVGLILLAVAAVVTPLGLYDGLAETTAETNFVYTRDSSPIGTSSPNRDFYNVSRLCGWWIWKSCPGQFHGYTWTSNSTGSYAYWNSTDDYISSVVPDNLTEIFSSGRRGDLKTVAGPFDLQYRTYILTQSLDPNSVLVNNTARFNMDQQRLRTVGDVKTYDSLILSNSFVVRDGIVADMRNGGIGFRNHTMPEDAGVVAEWSESLLWVEPESICINNNISLEFQSTRSATSYAAFLVDNGGLLAIKNSFKYPTVNFENTQDKNELYARAFRGATFINYNLALMLNANVSGNGTYLGRRYRIPSSYPYQPNKILAEKFDLGVPYANFETYMNPFQNLSRKLVTSIDLLVTGYGGADVANISRIAASGGVVLGAPLKVNQTASDRDDPGTNYSAPIFSCATILKAYIMNVTFFANGSQSLDRLQVKNAIPRSYPAGSLPLWAIEKAADRFIIADSDLLWGLVDDSYQNDARLWTTRREHLYLPAGGGSFQFSSLYSSDSLAAGVPENILSTLYTTAWSSTFGDYAGEHSQPLAQKWANLSQSVQTMPKIISLVWTDIAINMLTSRRSQLNAKFPSVTTYDKAAAQKEPTRISVQVTIYSRVVKYRTIYAIPAILFCATYFTVLVIAIALRIMNRTTLPMLRSLLNQTSVGRAVLAERADTEDPQASARIKSMETKDWVKEYGAEDVGIGKDVKYSPLIQNKNREKASVHTNATEVVSNESDSLTRS